MAGHCPAVKPADVAARELGTATGRRISSLYLAAVILRSATINCDLLRAQCLPRPYQSHPQTCHVPQASVGETFPAMSVYTTSTIRAKKSEARLVRKKDSSPLASTPVRGGPTYGQRTRRPLSRNRFRTVFGES